MSSLDKITEKEPSIPIADKYLVSKEEIPIKGEGYSFAIADTINSMEITILIPHTMYFLFKFFIFLV